MFVHGHTTHTARHSETQSFSPTRKNPASHHSPHTLHTINTQIDTQALCTDAMIQPHPHTQPNNTLHTLTLTHLLLQLVHQPNSEGLGIDGSKGCHCCLCNGLDVLDWHLRKAWNAAHGVHKLTQTQQHTHTRCTLHRRSTPHKGGHEI